MNLVYISYKSVKSKPLSSLLSTLLFGFGVSIIILIFLVTSHLKNEITKNATGIDLVIGAKGSPLQLILANIFHVDFPTGNISLKESAKLSKNRLIKSAIPISLGDSYSGYRIVGTVPAYLDLYGIGFEVGTWEQEEMQAVIGADVYEYLNLNVGDEFRSTHGLADVGVGHDEEPFVVSGKLHKSGTVLDKLIIVSVESVWHVHGHDEDIADSMKVNVEIPQLGLTVTKGQYEAKDVTALLVQYASPMAAIRLPQLVNQNSNFQAASPAFETARLFSLIGTGVEVMSLLGLIIIIISAISVFIALVNSLKERRYELAIMRSMGAKQGQIFIHVLLEGLFLTLGGILFGFVLAHGGFLLLGQFIDAMKTDGLFFVDQEIEVLIGGLLVGLLSSIVPAIMAYRSDISKTLAKG